MTCPETTSWIAFIDEPASAELASHLRECSACAARVEHLRSLREGLRVVMRVDAQPVAPRVIERLARARRPRAAWRYGFAAACVALVAVFALHSREESPFVMRGGGASVRPLSVAIYSTRASETAGRPVKNGAQVSSGDGLSFVLHDAPRGYFMLFAVDAIGEVHWFYPAYDDATKDPAAIFVSGGASLPLPEGVTPDGLPLGELAIFALTSEQPLRVSTVEKQLREHGRSGLEALGKGLHETRLLVAR